MFVGLALKTWGGLDNRVRGWLVLAGVVVFPLLWLYVGAYFALVVPQRRTELDAAEDRLDRMPWIASDGFGRDIVIDIRAHETPEYRRAREAREQRLRGLATPEYRHSQQTERLISQKADRFFAPIHAVDRALRPQTWGPLPSRPAPSIPEFQAP
jgi:hypothetical protein